MSQKQDGLKYRKENRESFEHPTGSRRTKKSRNTETLQPITLVFARRKSPDTLPATDVTIERCEQTGPIAYLSVTQPLGSPRACPRSAKGFVRSTATSASCPQ